MADLKIQTTTKPKSNHTALIATAGAAVGVGSRYILPTKNELGTVFNKEKFDTFVSSATTAARAEKRSVVKYGVVGALAATALSFLSKVFNINAETKQDPQYTKYQAILDAPDCACLAMWYKP